MFIVVGKIRRDLQVIGQEDKIADAKRFARDSVIQGTVAEAHVVETEASYYASDVNRDGKLEMSEIAKLIQAKDDKELNKLAPAH